MFILTQISMEHSGGIWLFLNGVQFLSVRMKRNLLLLLYVLAPLNCGSSHMVNVWSYLSLQEHHEFGYPDVGGLLFVGSQEQDTELIPNHVYL